jgi:glycosyltransferase involved in cell wall biosynthesis
MTAIAFLHEELNYSGETLRSASMGGTESSVVQLAEALARRGHEVSVFNGIKAPREEFGVRWFPLAQAPRQKRGDIGIAVANARAFNGLRFHTHILWLHNPLKSWRTIRRGNMGPLFARRPYFVLLGRYHASRVPLWFPSSGRGILLHGVHESFFRKAPASAVPPPRAIFTSQPYRGLDWLLALWSDVRGAVPEATFDVFAPKAHQGAANVARATQEGVSVRGSVSRERLGQELSTCRVQFIPGHRDETFCLAAAEATAAGVPIVTLGAGALSERVRHGRTGFIASNREEFASFSARLLRDDVLWSEMHRACLAEADLKTWDCRAQEWERLFADLCRKR